MPLHMIFRAGSLIANMIMGIIILSKKYDLSKYLSVGMITCGIIICTIISGSNVKSTQVIQEEIEEDSFSVLFWWVVGITLLTVALFVSARMGLYQEVLYKRYGKHPSEALFYTVSYNYSIIAEYYNLIYHFLFLQQHLLPLPGFLLLFNNISDHMVIASNSPLYLVPYININLPILWVYLLGNVLTQYLCISSVYILTTECSSLTVTLVVTLRKFVSLLFSIVYFSNPFTFYHWIGTILVFIGTIIFTECITKFKQLLNMSVKDDENKYSKIKTTSDDITKKKL